MIDPKEVLEHRWQEYRDKFIPADASSSQKSALGYAYYRGMNDLMIILHKASSTEPVPADDDLAAFMNGLSTALDEFHDALPSDAKDDR